MGWTLDAGAIEQLLANDKQKKLVVARPDYGPSQTPSVKKSFYVMGDVLPLSICESDVQLICKMVPVLSRLQAFLPEMSEANNSLLKRLEGPAHKLLNLWSTY
eukprot:1185882-Prorocentrum_minimum.AAC.5